MRNIELVQLPGTEKWVDNEPDKKWYEVSVVMDFNPLSIYMVVKLIKVINIKINLTDFFSKNKNKIKEL